MRATDGDGHAEEVRARANELCVFELKVGNVVRKEARVSLKNEGVVKELSSVPPKTLRRTSYPRARARIDISDQRRVRL